MSIQSIRETKRKARKPKYCYLCEQIIDKGSAFIESTCTDTTEGTISNIPMHIKCYGIAQEHYNDWDWENHDAYEFREEYLKKDSKPCGEL